MTQKSVLSFSLTGILTGIPDNTALPAGKYVYQKTKAGLGNIPGDRTRRHQVRIWTAGTNPNTAAQRPRRALFKMGVTAWHDLTPAEQQALKTPAEKRGLNNFQLFMSTYMKTHDAPIGAIWNGGAVTWNGGAGIWNL